MLKQFKCGFCENVFEHKSDFMNHRKKQHTQSVPACRDNINGTCRRDTSTCWFKHEDSNHENTEHESSDMMKRLFEMMENFTERMNQMETQLYN
jgi:hypothetical protein